jgi:hypothetical protein
MNPHPIAIRIPTGAGPRPLPVPEGEPEPAEDGATFADLLSAMLAPAVQPEPQSPGAPETVFDRLDAAQIFNETGLFRGAAPLAAGGEAAPGAPPALPASVQPPISPAEAEQIALSPPAAPATEPQPSNRESIASRQVALAGGAGPVPGTSAPPASKPSPLSLRGQPGSALPGPAPAPEPGPDPIAADRSARAAVMRLQAQLARAASTSAQVSVQAVEGGISVAARADRLSRGEKDRLRLEIGELLASHGLTAAAITLNGEAWPSPSERNG